MAFFAATLGGERDLDELLAALVSGKHDANAKLLADSTPLHMAAALGSAAGAALLLQHGADALAFDGSNRSPLAVACAHGHASVARLILDATSLKHAATIMAIADSKGWNCLHHAVLGGSAEAVQLLLDRGVADALAARPPPASAQLHTPLHLAACRGDAKVSAALCAAMPQLLHARCEGARDALQLASENGHHAAVAALLEAKADVRARDADGWTALHWAAAMEHAATSRLLLAAGADRASRSDKGEPMPEIPGPEGGAPAAEAPGAPAAESAAWDGRRRDAATDPAAAPASAGGSRVLRLCLIATGPSSVLLAIAEQPAAEMR
jgi:ankyrin repeat protein